MVEMTDLLSRPILRVTSAAAPSERPGVLVAALGSAGVALSGLLLCVAVSAAGWFAADTGSFGQAAGVGALAWLLSNGSGLAGSGLSVNAVPLGFLLAGAYALYRAGRWAASTSRVRSLADVGVATLAMSGAYGAVGAVTAVVANVDGVHAPVLRASAACLAVAGACGGVGLLRGSGEWSPLWARLPEEARAAFVGGAGGFLVMAAVGAVILTGSLVVHVSTALRLAEGMHGGLVGGVILSLVGAATVPNAVLCAGAFVAGPGFAVGTGTHVSPSGVHVGLLPDFPVLAALPTSADARWLPGLFALPVIAGAVAGVLANRRYPVYGVDHAALRGALAGLAGGVAFGLMTVLATGSVGPGRMQDVGPDVLATTLVCAVAFALGGVIAPVAHRWLGGALRFRRRRSPDEEITQPLELTRDVD
jgi:hypothetical protein